MMTRLLIRIAHPGTFKPSDRPLLLSRAQAATQVYGADVRNIRVARRAIELDWFVDAIPAADILQDIWKPLGPLVTTRLLGDSQVPRSDEAIMREAHEFFLEERYWEVHEALEELWKRSRGPEKNRVQGIILVAAALVHVQKNELAVVPSMLRSGLERLGQEPADCLGWDMAGFRRLILDLLSSEKVDFPLDVPWGQV